MASVGEIVAEVVTHETTVLYDDELLAEMKSLTVEELYVRLDKELDKIDPSKLYVGLSSEPSEKELHYARMKQLENQALILSYFCELYRRNIIIYSDTFCDIDNVWCQKTTKHIMNPDDLRTTFDCCALCAKSVNPAKPETVLSKKDSMDLHEQTITKQYMTWFENSKKSLKEKIRKLRKTRDLHLSVVKQPRMYEEINDLLDTILDTNGNKISAFKEYLSPEHYRLIRAGVDVKEIKEPTELLAALRKMEMTLESK